MKFIYLFRTDLSLYLEIKLLGFKYGKLFMVY